VNPVNTETIWLISIAVDVYDTAAPVAARRSLESAKRRCDEHRKLATGDDYSVGPISWETGHNGDVTGEAVITFTVNGQQHETKQLFILEEINLED
jgi:hypothetical protein